MVNLNLKIYLKIYLSFLITFFAFTCSWAQTNQSQQFEQAQILSQRHPDSALIILKKLHAHALNQNNPTEAGISLQQMGQICFNQSHYAQALDFYQHADKLFNQQK